MSADAGEVEISVTPVTAGDYERLCKAQYFPRLKLKLSTEATLKTVLQNVTDQTASVRPENTRVELFVKTKCDFVRLPLCLSVPEYLAMTNQETDGEIWYKCIGNGDDQILSQPESRVFYSGLSMYSNSFGTVVPGAGMDGGAGTPAEKVTDLRNELERLLKERA